MSQPGPDRHQSPPPWAGRLVRLLAVALFLFIAWLTLPKLAPRMYRLVKQRDARVEIARKNSGRPQPSPDEAVRSSDVLLIGGVALGGGLVLLSLGYVVLRREARDSLKSDDFSHPSDRLKSNDFSYGDGGGLKSGDFSYDVQAKRDLSE